MGEGAVGEAFGIGRITQIKAAERNGVERQTPGCVVGFESGGEAAPELVETAFFIDKEYVGLVGGVVEPGLAEGDTSGKVGSEVGLFGAGLADEEVEAGAGEEVGDGPIYSGRGRHELIGGVGLAGLVGAVYTLGHGLVDEVELEDKVFVFVDGFGEGAEAGAEIGVVDFADGIVGGLPVWGEVWRVAGAVGVLDQGAEDLGRRFVCGCCLDRLEWPIGEDDFVVALTRSLRWRGGVVVLHTAPFGNGYEGAV